MDDDGPESGVPGEVWTSEIIDAIGDELYGPFDAGMQVKALVATCYLRDGDDLCEQARQSWRSVRDNNSFVAKTIVTIRMSIECYLKSFRVILSDPNESPEDAYKQARGTGINSHSLTRLYQGIIKESVSSKLPNAGEFQDFIEQLENMPVGLRYEIDMVAEFYKESFSDMMLGSGPMSSTIEDGEWVLNLLGHVERFGHIVHSRYKERLKRHSGYRGIDADARRDRIIQFFEKALKNWKAPLETSMPITHEQLQGQLQSLRLRLLDVRSKEDYDAGHIPGAVWLDRKPAEEMARKPGGLEDRGAWAEWIEPLGIRPGDTVVVYDESRQKDAARYWWLLTYLGVENVALLNGNFGLWQEEGRPVSTEAAQVAPHAFPVALRKEKNATREDVLEAIRSLSTRVIDARSHTEYTGEQVLSKRGGHIPEACHLEWSNFVDEQGRFLSIDELRELVTRAGVQPGQPVITHCQGGGRASVNAFVFELLGHPAANYYPGWSDYGNAEDVPIQSETKRDESK